VYVHRASAQLHSSPGDESSDDISPYRQQQQQYQRGGAVDSETALMSRQFSVLRPLADRHVVLLRVATATLHAAQADRRQPGDSGGGRTSTVETIRLVDRRQSAGLPSVTDDDDVVAVVENSPSDEYAETGCPSVSPTPRRTCTSVAVHSSVADDEVFHAAVPGATLTVESCLVDGRPSFSSSADGHTDWTRLSGSDDSPQPESRPSASPSLVVDSTAVTQVRRLDVPSPPCLPQSRDRKPTTPPSAKSARGGIRFRSTAEQNRASKSTASSKRSTRREKKVTKTLAIVLGESSSLSHTLHLPLVSDA